MFYGRGKIIVCAALRLYIISFLQHGSFVVRFYMMGFTCMLRKREGGDT